MNSSLHRYVLVTGANSGLGLGICKRLIDDFLNTQPSAESLTIIFTTRSSRKSADTLKTLTAHLSEHPSKDAKHRVQCKPESVELTSLLSVRDLARKLLASELPHLNAVILNAGIGGWSGLDWPLCIKSILLDITQATTWPTYKSGVIGLVTKPQLPPIADGQRIEEPVIGEVFCANIFGHYMLAHWLMPLLWACDKTQTGKIVWIGSIEPAARHYNPDDTLGLSTDAAYEHGKRLTDYLAITAQRQPATNKSLQTFLAPSPNLASKESRRAKTRPTMQVVQPGICVTGIVSLYWILQQGYLLGIYLARWCGSPWATVSTYTAALAATWIALASPEELEAKEAEDGGGAGKWGTAVDRLGRPTVRRTDIEGWGINGSGKTFKETWWGGSTGRIRGAKDATKEDVDGFIAQGVDAWKRMEQLRIEWEARLEEYDRLSG